MSLTTQQKLTFAAVMSLVHMAGTPLMRTIIAHGDADPDNMRNMFYMQLTGCLLTMPAYYLCASLASYAALDDNNANNRTGFPQTRVVQLIVLIGAISTSFQATTGKAILDLLSQLLDVKILDTYKHGGFQSENSAIFDTNVVGFAGDLIIAFVACVLALTFNDMVVYRQPPAYTSTIRDNRRDEEVALPQHVGPPSSQASVVGSLQMVIVDSSNTDNAGINLSAVAIAIPAENKPSP